MRELHLIDTVESAENDTGRLVLATSDELERFSLYLDDAVRTAVTGRPAPGPSTPDAAPSGDARPSPREIQTRVRAGADARTVAEQTGSSLQWVERFAAPVLAERARIADEARRAKARRSTTEGQVVVFGEAVDARFAVHGIDPADVRWDALRRDDGQWIVVAHWAGGQGEYDAEWTFHLGTRTVAPADDTAADLLSDRPVRPVTHADPAPPALSLAPPLAPGVVAFPVLDDLAPPVRDEVFDQTHYPVSDKGTGSPTARYDSPTAAPGSDVPRPAPGDAVDPVMSPSGAAAVDEPVLPLHVPDAPEITSRIPRLTATRIPDEERAARSAIPSWDDILLGVRRKRD